MLGVRNILSFSRQLLIINMHLTGRSRLTLSCKLFIFSLWRWQILERQDEKNTARTGISVVVFGIWWDIQRPESEAQLFFFSRRVHTLLYCSCTAHSFCFTPTSWLPDVIHLHQHRCQSMRRPYGGMYVCINGAWSNFGPSAFVISKDWKISLLSLIRTFLTRRIQLTW